ncbi:hypothetical protein MUO32_06460 [Shinella sp. CPCC 101442]|uniref:hypothetical protein n=1 Tax=Shinella sp. CPCC 101442 TaxID=2932265 RepID=UPI00215267DF|nr:hypothetical protein [Shinella sp. CPCC 101442]MCR6498664.1 hypothetical protein [Shinella sp. CPCC 101442]
MRSVKRTPAAPQILERSRADTFQFKSIANSTLISRDTIYDFMRAQGDNIDFLVKVDVLFNFAKGDFIL